MAMVEMVFVLPVLLLLVFAIAEFGLMLNRKLTLSNAARDGARAGVAYRFPCDGANVEAEIESVVTTIAGAGGLDPVTTQVVGECLGRSQPLTVTVTYDFMPLFPFAGEFFGGDAIQLLSTFTMLNE